MACYNLPKCAQTTSAAVPFASPHGTPDSNHQSFEATRLDLRMDPRSSRLAEIHAGSEVQTQFRKFRSIELKLVLINGLL